MTTARPPRFQKAKPKPAPGVCRGCGEAVGKGLRNWCSGECRDSHWFRWSGSLMREQVKQRDKGICALCSLDTVTLRVTFSLYASRFGIRWTGELPIYLPPPVSDFLSFHHIPRFRASSRDWWDADHIQPVVKGGGSCGLDNIRTLCIPCHKAVTRAQRARAAG